MISAASYYGPARWSADSECYNPRMVARFRRPANFALLLFAAIMCFAACAIATLAQTSARTSAQTSAKQAATWIEQAHAQAAAGRFADAIASYRDALSISPHNLNAEIGLAQAFRGVHNQRCGQADTGGSAARASEKRGAAGDAGRSGSGTADLRRSNRAPDRGVGAGARKPGRAQSPGDRIQSEGWCRRYGRRARADCENPGARPEKCTGALYARANLCGPEPRFACAA